MKYFYFLLFIVPLQFYNAFCQTKAFEQNEKLGRGINLGNALEAPNEGEWGVTLEASYFELIAEKGFNSVRIPVRWSAHTLSNDPFTINESFFQRVDWAIDNALKNKLMAIINIHHYEEIFSDPDGEKGKFLQIWTQISNRYKDYSDSLVFEILNEPHDNLTAEKWNVFLADAYDIIRNTNPDKTLFIGLAEWGGTSALNKLVLPADDDNIILTVHYYNPFQFTHQGAEWVDGADDWLGTKWENTVSERAQIENEIAYVVDYSQTNNIPVNMGEFGSYSKADETSREIWTTYCARLFEEKGFSWHYWEFCSGFGIYDASTGTWNNGLVDALLHSPMPEPWSTTGLNYLIKDQIKVYPNPGTNTIYLEGDNISSVLILNARGQVVKSLFSQKGEKKAIYLKNEPKGLYFIKIKDRDGVVHSQKIVLE